MTLRPVVVKQLPAQLKLGQVQNFLREVTPLLTADRPRIVFDFSQVSQIDSAGVDLLLYCVEQAMKRNGDLKLAAVPPASAVILELTQVDRLFEIFDTVAEAEDSFYRFSPASAAPLAGRSDGEVRNAGLKSSSDAMTSVHRGPLLRARAASSE